MADVFLSYARGDCGVAERLANAIGDTGLTVWWDRHIKGGADFSRDIERQLDAASRVLVLWSKEAVDSRWVRDEASIAADSGRLVSATIDGTRPPLGFRQFQTIDLKEWTAKGAAIPPALAEAFGVEAARSGALPGFPPEFVEQAHKLTRARGSSYEGFWRTYRPSVMMPGTIFRDHGMIRIDADGYLSVRMGGAGMTFQGIILPGDSNLFAVFYNSIGTAPYLLIAKGVQLPRADLLEGLLLLSALDAVHTPAAVPIVLERIGDLSGNRADDDLRCDELIKTAPIAKDGEVPEDILSRLIRDVGPAAAAHGGERFLMTASAALSRGSTNSGDLRG